MTLYHAVYKLKGTLAVCPRLSGSVSGESFGGVPDLLLTTLLQKQHAWRKEANNAAPNTHKHTLHNNVPCPQPRIMCPFCFPIIMLQIKNFFFFFKTPNENHNSIATEINPSILPHILYSLYIFIFANESRRQLGRHTDDHVTSERPFFLKEKCYQVFPRFYFTDFIFDLGVYK